MRDPRPFVDFTVETPGEGVRLLVEASNTAAPSREWVTRFLRNLFVHAQIPKSPYFLLALRDHFYLWRGPAPDATAPDFVIDTTVALRPYLGRLSMELEKLSASSFELLVESWLEDLVAGTLPDGPDPWLEESGLAAAVRDGEIRTNVSA